MFRVVVIAATLLCLSSALRLSNPEATLEEVTTTVRPSGPASYWIAYSKKLRPGHPLVFQAQIFKGSSPVDVVITLKNYKDEVVISKGPVSISPGSPQNINIDIPLDVKKPQDEDTYWNQNYKLQVTGKGVELKFKEEGYIEFEQKAFSIFVQTDKAMYKPSQKVQFRVLAMTPDMKVLKDVKYDIVVMDAKGNRILQYKGLEANENLGVIQKSFNLANSVPTGKWEIKVTVEGIEETKEFEVSDYVLPRFEVKIDGPPYGLASDPVYEFTVNAKFTFGEPVTKGEVDVAVYVAWRSAAGKSLRFKGSLNSEGEMKVQITKASLLEFYKSTFRYSYQPTSVRGIKFTIDANVTEERTGKTLSGSMDVPFHDNHLKVSFLDITPTSFKSGLDYTAYIEVTKQDGTLFTPVESKSIRINVNVTYNVPAPPATTTTQKPNPANDTSPTLIADVIHVYPGYRPTIQKVLALDQDMYAVPDSGWVLVTFRVPDEARSIVVKAEAVSPMGKRETTKYADKSISPSDSFLQLKVLNKKPRVGDIVKVQAKATGAIKKLNYQVFSKGLLILSQEASTSPSSPNTLEFEFAATVSMSPSMSLVAFYVRDDGEFVVDGLSISVEGLFDDAVSVEFSKSKVQPGEQVNAIIKGQKDSVVFLLAVDKSVKLLKSGNDITQDLIREVLTSYDYGNYGNWRYMFMCGWPSFFGGSDAASVLQSAGVGVMTDGVIYSRYNNPDSFKGDGDGAPVLVPDNALGENAGSVAPEGRFPSTSVQTRKNFPESWLWQSVVVGLEDGEVTIPLTAQDTITTWLASAFSVNPTTGLSVAAKPAELTTFRNLFVTLDLPTSIVRNENFCFLASVFSYYPQEIPVMLTLDQNPDFRTIYVKEENKEIIQSEESLYLSNVVGTMTEGEYKTVTFCFSPKTIGTITLTVTALTDVQGLSDRVERTVQVKPEGVPRATTIPHLVEITDGTWQENVPFEFPLDTVAGSERVTVNIAGNLLGPIFENLEDLLKKPYGCGEQNMINFSPIMSLLDFFFTTNTITDEIRAKAVDYMLIGYQKELRYEHGKTGGYSTFGDRDDTKENPSMWLTAFITKCFAQAEQLDMKHKDILAIDTDVILRSSLWMLSQQKKDGSFVENGRVFNTGLQGGSGKGVSLTAYTVIALHESLTMFKQQKAPTPQIQQIERRLEMAMRFLERSIDALDDPYDVCITAYALHLVNSNLKDVIFNKMESKANKGFGMTNWARPKQDTPVYYYWSRGNDAINVEMTAYGLLTYSLRGIGTSEGLSIVRWLSKKKGPNGGFVSTQDTVIGIEALASVAKRLYGSEFVPMTVQVSTRGGVSISSPKIFQITKDNEMVLQRQDIPYQAGGDIQLSATADKNLNYSQSTVLVDVVFNYNVKSETQADAYGLDHKVREVKGGYELTAKVWTTNGKNASMTILEVEIPAGYSPDSDTILANEAISKTDVKDGSLNVYINTGVIDSRGIFVKVPLLETSGKLTKAEGKSIRVYDYYNQDNEKTMMYVLTSEPKDICTQVPEFGICPFQESNILVESTLPA